MLRMANGTKWISINRNEFLNALITICDMGMKLMKIAKSSGSNFMIGKNELTEIMSFDALGFEYEIDKNLGCYRFKSKTEGPWTKWASIEEAA